MHNNKHAYLIMAHHRPDLLKELLLAIDDARNDVYLHIDKKSLRKMPPEQFYDVMQKSRLTVIPSKKVNWGGYSQIDCEMRLLEAAVSQGPDMVQTFGDCKKSKNASHTENVENALPTQIANRYAYYHLLTGSTYPLKYQDEIHQFFEEHAGKEFISFEKDPERYLDRVCYRHLFNESGKALTNQKSIRNRIRLWQNRRDKKKEYFLFIYSGLTFQKGWAYWSITDGLARYTLERKEEIKRLYKRSILADECFMQILVYNSKFKDAIYDYEGIKGGGMRLYTWSVENEGEARPGHNFILDDLPMLLSSDALFALKFEGPDGLELIQKIKGIKEEK